MARPLPAGNGYRRPAEGLSRLTWAQVQAIDAAISSLCARTEHTREQMAITITVRNGHPAEIGEPLLFTKLKPNRD